MTQNFFVRLKSYYIKVAEVLRGDADAASIFANTTDIGMSRELVYKEFLKQHAPSKCNVFLGGFLFDEDGLESNQLDIIITTDTTPRFNLHSKDGAGKSFSPVEGTLGVVSVKSMLNKAELFDALKGMASIPPTRTLEGRSNVLVKIKDYDDWPLKIIYASNGVAANTLYDHVNEYYRDNPGIPINRRPNIIHIAGSYLIMRAGEGMSIFNKDSKITESVEMGAFYITSSDSDLHAIMWTLHQIQQYVAASSHIYYSYGSIINKVIDL